MCRGVWIAKFGFLFCHGCQICRLDFLWHVLSWLLWQLESSFRRQNIIHNFDFLLTKHNFLSQITNNWNIYQKIGQRNWTSFLRMSQFDSSYLVPVTVRRFVPTSKCSLKLLLSFVKTEFLMKTILITEKTILEQCSSSKFQFQLFLKEWFPVGSDLKSPVIPLVNIFSLVEIAQKKYSQKKSSIFFRKIP